MHIPVLLAETLAWLVPRPGGRYVDATINGGGHAQALLDASAPDGVVLGLDRDPQMVAAARARLADAVQRGALRLATASFAELGAVLAAHDMRAVDGMLFDLGLSSAHLDESGRGFSFAADEPLDMRFDAGDASRATAAEILASRTPDDLSAIFRTYGEERFASRIARTIAARRRGAPVRTSRELLAAIEASLPPQLRWRAARNAARVFQALRIAVNDELDAVAAALPQAVDSLASGGRLVVISFHSLEDRLVKQFLRDAQRTDTLRVLTKRPLQPSPDEIAANPRAASAKLRAAQKT
jgi:16S rRNA (cytosine1402-N4)-methyltransferase